MPTQFSTLRHLLTLSLCLSLAAFSMAGCKKGDKGPILDDTMTDNSASTSDVESDDGDPGVMSAARRNTIWLSANAVPRAYASTCASSVLPATG